MSFYDDASLIMFPSGYKEDKIYSLKPTDGSGDLTFTRASTATRVNSEGLIETSPVNLLSYSEQFDNAAWTKSNTTITPNVATAPNGTMTADKSTIDTSTTYHDSAIQSFSTIIGQVYTLTLFAKKGTGIEAFYYYSPDGGFAAKFNLNNGAYIGHAPSDGYNEFTAYGSENLGDSWYRFYATYTATTTNSMVIGISTNTSNSIVPILGNGTDFLYIWGAQVNIGATAKPYFPTTDRLNVPRIDYTGGGCGKLLLESQRTNLALYSEQFDNAAWAEGGVSVTANNTTSPDGTQNADKLTEDSSNGNHLFYNLNPIVGAATSTASIFYKKGTRRYFSIKLQIGSNSYTQVFDADAVTTGANSSNGLTSVSTSIVSMGNGWVRASLTGTDPLGLTATYFIFSLSNSATPTFEPSNKNPTYQGTGTDNGFVWGAQLEAGSYVSSYVPSLASSVTRLADAAYKTGISSLIGQTQGTLFGKFTFDSSETVNRVFSITGTDWNTDGSIRLDIISNKPEIYARKAGADIGSQGSINYTIAKGQTIKWALVYTASTMKIFIDGAQRGITTSLSTTPPACSELYVNQLGGGFTSLVQNNQRTLWSDVILFTSALSDTQLATLTTI